MTEVRPAVAAPPSVGSSLGRLRFLLSGLYLALVSVLSLWAAAWVPVETGPLDARVFAGAACVVRLRHLGAALRAWPRHPSLRAAWSDSALQTWSGAGERLARARQPYERLPGWLRALFPLDVDDAWDGLEGEGWVAVWPGEEPDGERAVSPSSPVLVCIPVSGARGALLRWAVAQFPPERGGLTWRNLDGKWIALGFYGARVTPGLDAERAAEAAPAGPFLPDAQVQVLFRFGAEPSPPPHLLPLALPPPIPAQTREAFAGPWSGPTQTVAAIAQVLGLAHAPDEVRLSVAPRGNGWRAVGVWKRAEPVTDRPGGEDDLLPAEAEAPLLAAGPSAAPPLLEARLPFDARASFQRLLEWEGQTEKGRQRWQNILSNLKANGVNLDTELWPRIGHILRLKLQPSPRGSPTGLPFASASLALLGDAVARRAWEDLLILHGRGISPKAETARPFAWHLRSDGADDYVWVSNALWRPACRLTANGWSVCADVSHLGLRPMPLQLAPLEYPALEPAFQRTFWLRWWGARLAPAARTLAQLYLKQRQEDLGAAAYMAAYPDPEVLPALASALTRLAGDGQVAVFPPAPGATGGRFELDWQPAHGAE